MTPDDLAAVLDGIPREAIPSAVARLLARALEPPPAPIPAAPAGNGVPDELLTVAQAAQLINVSPRWIYEHRDRLPVRRIGDRTLRFSRRGLVRWIERTTPDDAGHGV